MAPVSMNFGPQNSPRTSVEDQSAARMIEDYYDFPTGSDFLSSRSITDADRDPEWIVSDGSRPKCSHALEITKQLQAQFDLT